MINLELLDACEKCPNLDVENNTSSFYSLNGIEYHHTITCKNIGMCRALLEHLQKEVKKDGNEENR